MTGDLKRTSAEKVKLLVSRSFVASTSEYDYFFSRGVCVAAHHLASDRWETRHHALGARFAESLTSTSRRVSYPLIGGTFHLRHPNGKKFLTDSVEALRRPSDEERELVTSLIRSMKAARKSGAERTTTRTSETGEEEGHKGLQPNPVTRLSAADDVVDEDGGAIVDLPPPQFAAAMPELPDSTDFGPTAAPSATVSEAAGAAGSREWQPSRTLTDVPVVEASAEPRAVAVARPTAGDTSPRGRSPLSEIESASDAAALSGETRDSRSDPGPLAEATTLVAEPRVDGTDDLTEAANPLDFALAGAAEPTAAMAELQVPSSRLTVVGDADLAAVPVVASRFSTIENRLSGLASSLEALQGLGDLGRKVEQQEEERAALQAQLNALQTELTRSRRRGQMLSTASIILLLAMVGMAAVLLYGLYGT